jgi:hypothetical protein
VLKFAVGGEIFAHAFGTYVSIARLGKILIRSVGVVLVLASAVAAAYTPQDGLFGIISGTHLLEQTTNIIATGLLVFISLFCAYFHLRLDGPLFGISLGLIVTVCVHLATSVVDTNGVVTNQRRTVLDFIDMVAYHGSVLIWYYYLLLPHKVATKSVVPLPENNLAVWNRELERLLHS